MPPAIDSAHVQSWIYFIRGHRVMLDRDLATMYGVSTKNLNKAVKRNVDRFPGDFMFQLTRKELDSLRFQNGTLKRGQHSKYRPHVFTQEGVAMLSGLLRSRRAVRVNIEIMRAFVRLRELIASHKDLAGRIEELEKSLENHDGQIHAIFDAIRRLMDLPQRRVRKIGFRNSGG